MRKVQRLNGYGHENLAKFNDCSRYSLIPFVRMSGCSLSKPVIIVLNCEFQRIMILGVLNTPLKSDLRGEEILK